MSNEHAVFVSNAELNPLTPDGRVQTLTPSGFALNRLSPEQYELCGWDGWEGVTLYLSLPELESFFDALRTELTVRGLLPNDRVSNI